MILSNITVYFLLFGVCNCFTFLTTIKNIFSINKSPDISIEIYNGVNTRGISSFIANERYYGLPNNLYNEMIGMMERDFSYRRKNCFSKLPFTILLAMKDDDVVGVITVECCDIDINEKKENHPVISNLIVSTKMRPDDGAPEIKIDWRIYTKNPDKPLIRDLIVEGLSLARTQKEEFSSILSSNNNDINILISKLEEFLIKQD